MNEKKKNLISKLFKGSGGCGCGVQIVEETPKERNDRNTSNNSKTEIKKD